MLLCLISSMTPPTPSPTPPPPHTPTPLLDPSLPWHHVFKLVLCQNTDLVTLGSAVVCVSCARRFCSLAGVQSAPTKRPIDRSGGRGRVCFHDTFNLIGLVLFLLRGDAETCRSAGRWRAGETAPGISP